MLEVDVIGQVGTFPYNLQFKAGSGVTAIWGRSGVGKTTLLRVLAGLEIPDSGHIQFDDKTWFQKTSGMSLSPAKRHTGYVPQNSALFPHMTVEKNLTYALRAGGRKPIVELSEISSMLGITELHDRYPAKLSGGEIRRVALGRAMMSDPKLLVLDEPFSGLDEMRIVEISGFITQLNQQFGVPVVLVTHSARDVMRLADEMVVVRKGEISTTGKPEKIFSEMGISFSA